MEFTKQRIVGKIYKINDKKRKKEKKGKKIRLKTKKIEINGVLNHKE